MIVRIVRRENPFAQIDRRILENPALSWKAKGLLAYLLSKPPEWVVRLEDLVNSAKDGEDAVRSALRELKKAGHARLETVRSPTAGTVSGKRWVIFEEPLAAGAPTPALATDIGKTPMSENTDVGEIPTSGKSDPSNKEQSSKKEESISLGELFEPAGTAKPSPLPPALSTPAVLEAWAAYEEMRKKKRAPITPIVKTRIVHDLLEWGPELAALALWKSARKCWTDVYHPRPEGGTQKTTNTTTTTNGTGKKKFTAADAL